MDGVNGEIDLEVSGPVLNGGVDSETASLNGMPSEVLVDSRVKKLKAKRLLRQLSKETAVVNGQSGNLVTPPRSWKNTRRPRNGYGRGLAKKGTVEIIVSLSCLQRAQIRMFLVQGHCRIIQ